MPAKVAYFVGPWDLNRELACVPADPADGTVVLVESVGKSHALPYHKQKLVLVLSALRHFAEELREAGYDVDIVRARSYVAGIREHVERTGAERVVALEPREWGLAQSLTAQALGVPLELRADGGEGGHFLLTREEFAAWEAGQKATLRMDVFYRHVRKRFGVLLEEGKPVGGTWSYDAENRKAIPAEVEPPGWPGFTPDTLTRSVMADVRTWDGHWGDVEGFDWPVTRAQALSLLDDFVTHRLKRFGDYQDGIRAGDPFLWHSGIAAAMNLSLLHPREAIDAAVVAWESGEAPLNAVEGFVRQVLGWREFIRGVYWTRMPGMRDANTLDAHRPLPRFFWEPEATEWACLRDSAQAVLDHGYAHHIQRLMILGNFALLAGIRPLDVSHWFWAGFVDAYEWVQLPNVHGMALYADDGFTTKPYAASGAYMNRMSDYCGDCPKSVKQRHGEDACPFNPLFWRFMVEHRELLSKNPRVGVLYRSWDRWDAAEQQAILSTAEGILDGLEPAAHGWTFADDAG